MLRKTVNASLLFFFSTVLFYSCGKKKEEIKTSLDYSTEKEFSSSESDFNTVFKDVDEAMDINDDSQTNLRSLATSCVTKGNVTLYPDSAVGNYTSYLEIDFSTTCTDASFKNRSGKVLVFYSGKRITGDFKDSVIFSSFKLDGKTVSGYSITKQTAATNDEWDFDIYVNGKITTTSNEVITYEANRQRKHSGLSTRFNFTDDKFVITGSASGKNSKGDLVSSEIVTPVVINGSCLETYYRIPVEGKVTFKNNTKNITRSLDYGSGTCDREVTIITNDGNSFKWSL